MLVSQQARAEQIVEVLIRYGVAELGDDPDEHLLLAEMARNATPTPSRPPGRCSWQIYVHDDVRG